MSGSRSATDERRKWASNELANERKMAEREKEKGCKHLFKYLSPPTTPPRDAYVKWCDVGGFHLLDIFARLCAKHEHTSVEVICLKLWICETPNLYLNNGVKNYMNEDYRSYIRNFCSCGKKAWKKFRLVRDLNLWPLRCRCSALTIKLLASQLGAGRWKRTSPNFFQAFSSQLQKLRI